MRKILAIPFFILSITAQSRQVDVSVYEGVAFEMPQIHEPTFPDFVVSIVDHGAKADGLSNNAKAINDAIDVVSTHGGGTVLIPRGIWLTGPITFQSNVNLEVAQGALLLFSTNKDDYPLVATSFEGLNTYRCVSPISAQNVENIAITGTGVIDGNGGAWREVKKSKMPPGQWEKLVKSGGLLNEKGDKWYPSESFKRGAEATAGFFNVPETQSKEDFQKFKDFLRPVMVSLVNSKNILLDGPTFQNSPAWNIHPLMSENIIIRNIKVRNPWYSQNGDGLDLESCKNALVYNCTFDVGDDAICIKSGKNEDGRTRGIPTENVIIKNNTVYHGHGGFVVGSEMSGGVRNIHVSHLTFIGTDTGIRFKSTRGRGGVVENIYISDINMINIPTEPIRFNLFYGGQSPSLDQESPENVEAEPVTEATPSFKDIYIKNITAVGSGRAAYFQGLPEMKIQNVVLENIDIEAKYGMSILDVDGISFNNVQVQCNGDVPLKLFNSSNANLQRFAGITDEEAVIRVYGEETSDVVISGIPKDKIICTKGVHKKAVLVK